jgi:hypothetical protein
MYELRHGSFVHLRKITTYRRQLGILPRNGNVFVAADESIMNHQSTSDTYIRLLLAVPFHCIESIATPTTRLACKTPMCFSMQINAWFLEVKTELIHSWIYNSLSLSNKTIAHEYKVYDRAWLLGLLVVSLLGVFLLFNWFLVAFLFAWLFGSLIG